MAHIHKQFGNRIKELRKDKGMSQEELALLAGMDRSYFGAVERGERNVAFTNIEKIANALSVDLKDLFNFGEDAEDLPYKDC